MPESRLPQNGGKFETVTREFWIKLRLVIIYDKSFSWIVISNNILCYILKSLLKIWSNKIEFYFNILAVKIEYLKLIWGMGFCVDQSKGAFNLSCLNVKSNGLKRNMCGFIDVNSCLLCLFVRWSVFSLLWLRIEVHLRDIH